LDQSEVITVMKDAIGTILSVTAPILAVAMTVGLAISIFQATTQINDQTISFVPKIIAVLVMILVSAGMIISSLTGFTERMFGYVTTMLT
jgi:flagellar biosynthesis protein FliQ